MSSNSAASPDRPASGGGRLIFTMQCLRIGVRLGTAALLARLLSPADYGLYGMAAVIYGVLHMARELGVVTALQQPGLARGTFDACCRLSLGGGLLLAVLGAALAFPAAWLYGGEPRVTAVLAAMSLALAFASASSPPIGLLYRAQRSGLVAGLDGAAMLLSSIAGVILAANGAGVWALVVMGVLMEVIFCTLAWWCCPPWPESSVPPQPLRSLIGFGANLTGHNLAAYVTRTLDQFVVGRVDGPFAIGLYGRGAQVVALPSQYGIAPFTGHIVATLARLRPEAENYRAFFRQAVNSLTHVAFFSAALCAAVPDLIVRLLFGPQWHDAVPVVRTLAMTLALQPWLTAPYWLLGSMGSTRRLLRWALCGAMFMIAACVVAAPHGMVAIAIAAAATSVAHALLGPAFCADHSPVSTVDWLRPAVLPALVHGGLGVAMWLANRSLSADAGLAARAAIAFLVLVGYGGAWLACLPRLRTELRQHLFIAR